MLTIDSCIWAYYFDKDSAEHPLVTEPVDKALRSEKIVLNTVIIMEVAHFLIKNLGPITGKNKLEVFLSFPFLVLNLDYDLTLDAIEHLKNYSHLGIGGRDATVIATMKNLGFNKIMTHDEAFKRLSWLEVLDPIQEK
jgi:predicted nucleic acid-binding protein